MSLREAKLFTVSLKQYFYKLKANVSLVYGLILIQITALALSLGGLGGGGGGSGPLTVLVRNYSGKIVIVFTLSWMLGSARILPTKPYRDRDFTFVSNRLSGGLANIAFLLTACVYGGLTSSLFSLLLRVIIYFRVNKIQAINAGFSLSFRDFLFGMGITILYLMLVAGASYLFGVLTQISATFLLIIPAALIGLAFLNYEYLLLAFRFFIAETSPALFIFKALAVTLILFGLSVLLSRRMEVRE